MNKNIIFLILGLLLLVSTMSVAAEKPYQLTSKGEPFVEGNNLKIMCSQESYSFLSEGLYPVYCSITDFEQGRNFDVSVLFERENGVHVESIQVQVPKTKTVYTNLTVNNTTTVLNETVDYLGWETPTNLKWKSLLRDTDLWKGKKFLSNGTVKLKVLLNVTWLDPSGTNDEFWVIASQNDNILLELDPAVSGCTENATTILCSSGTFVGNWIDTTKNIVIENAIVNGSGTIGAAGALRLNSTSGDITITDSYIEAKGGNGIWSDSGSSGGTTNVFFYGDNFYNNNVTFNVTGGLGSGANRVGGSSYKTINMTGDIYLTDVLFYGYGGNSIQLRTSASNGNNGGNSYTYIYGNALYGVNADFYVYSGSGSNGVSAPAGSSGYTRFVVDVAGDYIFNTSSLIDAYTQNGGSISSCMFSYSGGSSGSSFYNVSGNRVFYNDTPINIETGNGGSGCAGSHGISRDVTFYGDSQQNYYESSSVRMDPGTSSLTRGETIIWFNATSRIALFANSDFTTTNLAGTAKSNFTEVGSNQYLLGVFDSSSLPTYDVFCTESGVMYYGNDSTVTANPSFDSSCGSVSYINETEFISRFSGTFTAIDIDINSPTNYFWTNDNNLTVNYSIPDTRNVTLIMNGLNVSQTTQKTSGSHNVSSNTSMTYGLNNYSVNGTGSTSGIKFINFDNIAPVVEINASLNGSVSNVPTFQARFSDSLSANGSLKMFFDGVPVAYQSGILNNTWTSLNANSSSKGSTNIFFQATDLAGNSVNSSSITVDLIDLNISISIRDEFLDEPFNYTLANSSITLRLECEDGGLQFYNVSSNNLTVRSCARDYQPMKFSVTSNVDQTQGYYRGVLLDLTSVPESTQVVNKTFYLINLEVTPVVYETTFIVTDPFNVLRNAYIYLEKDFNNSLDTQISTQLVGLGSQTLFYLIASENYDVYIKDYSTNFSQYMGRYTATGVRTQVLGLSDFNLNQTPSLVATNLSIYQNTTFNNATSSLSANLFMIDNTISSSSNSLTWTVYKNSVGGPVVYTNTYSSQSNVAVSVNVTSNINDTLIGVISYSNPLFTEDYNETKVIWRDVKANLTIVQIIGQNAINWVLFAVIALLAMYLSSINAYVLNYVVIGVGFMFGLIFSFGVGTTVFGVYLLLNLLGHFMQGGNTQ